MRKMCENFHFTLKINFYAALRWKNIDDILKQRDLREYFKRQIKIIVCYQNLCQATAKNFSLNLKQKYFSEETKRFFSQPFQQFYERRT